MRTLESIQAEIKALGEVDLFGTAKEVSHLPEVLHDDENIKYLTSGLMNGTTWLIVCTQKRIVMLDYGMFFGIKQSEMNLESINSISYQTGLLFGAIEIWHGGARMLIENCEKRTIKPFVEAVQSAMKEQKAASQSSSQTAAPVQDIAGQIEKLAALMDKGLLTKEEFDAQKTKLLGMA